MFLLLSMLVCLLHLYIREHNTSNPNWFNLEELCQGNIFPYMEVLGGDNSLSVFTLLRKLIIIMVIFKCYFSGELIALSQKIV